MNSNVKIENVVASASLGQKFDLELITLAIDKVEYEPEQFPGLVYHLDKPKAAALIFGSGKIVCTGAKSIPEAKIAISRIIDKIREGGTEITGKPEVIIQNVVATANLHAELNLDAIAIGLDNTEYEPEQFPGLVYRMKVPKVVLLLFGSGKIVCTGAKSVGDAEQAAKNVRKKLAGLGLL
jgi:transcription initiation factor TFIID TATA-box-binding protein|tara:strand:- start:791 stop:1333 length:543 start_codon:yes stop_codon:yes gene_type:complete